MVAWWISISVLLGSLVWTAIQVWAWVIVTFMAVAGCLGVIAFLVSFISTIVKRAKA